MGKSDKIKLAVAILLLAAAGGIVYWFGFHEETLATPPPAVLPSPTTPIEGLPPAPERPSGGGARRAINQPG